MHETTPHPRSGSSAGPWWSDKVVYRIDLRSFSDSDSDGVGDLDGLRHRLGYVELLGVDAMWVTGVLASPIGKGRGHEVDPAVGTLESFALLIGEAHASNLRVVLDTPVSSRDIDTPAARERIATTIEGWAELGVDGVRLAASPGLTGPADESTHDVLELVRPVIDEYPQCMLGAFVDRWSTRRGHLHQIDVGLDDRFCTVTFDSTRVRSVIATVLTESECAHASPAWALSDWKHPRPPARFGGGAAGLARARAMALVQCALPGVVGLNNGSELGLSEPMTPEQAPSDSLRGLMPWEGTEPPFGFSAGAESWWPSNPAWVDSTVEAELEDPASTLSLHRRALEIRRKHSAGHGSQVRWYGSPAGCLAFRRDGGGLTCALNTSPDSVPLPPGELLLTSGPLEDDRLPPNTAAWLT